MSQSVSPISPNARIAVTLEAQQWNSVVEIIARSTGFPYFVTAPLIQAIGAQLQSGAAAQQQMTPPQPNGGDRPVMVEGLR